MIRSSTRFHARMECGIRQAECQGGRRRRKYADAYGSNQGGPLESIDDPKGIVWDAIAFEFDWSFDLDAVTAIAKAKTQQERNA